MTVYVPVAETDIEFVVSPVLHNNDPVNDSAVNTVLPQLSATVTTGADGMIFGTATPLAGSLVQPSTVCVNV
mgnify:CR=1 FL=1